MIYSKIPGLDKSISRVVQGTIMLSSKEKNNGFSLLDGVFSNGCTTFDTAHNYGAENGDADRVLGLWIKERQIRNKVVIIAKGCHHNKDRRRVTPFDLTSDLMDTLARLQTTYVDIYLLHRDDPSQSVKPIVDALAEHKRAGRIGLFGGSNWSTKRIEEANTYATSSGLPLFTISSPNYSLAIQKKEPWENCVSISTSEAATERNWYKETQMPLFVWSSLAGGFFSGRFRRNNLNQMKEYFDRLCVETYGTEENFQRFDAAQEIATARKVSVPQIALAYIFSKKLNIFALVGSRTPTEFSENAQGAEIILTKEEIAKLELKQE